MIIHHYSFTDLGGMLAGIAALTDIAKMEGCTDVDAIEVDGGNFQKGRMTLCKKTCFDNQPCFAIEFNEQCAPKQVMREGELLIDRQAAKAPPPAPVKRGRRPRLVEA